MKNISIFLSTSDGYSDCWEPFFTLLKKYWPEYDGTIYMTTEYLDYSFEGLDIKSLKICYRHSCSPSKQPKWSKRMRWALEMVPDDIILFMQEDFFLKDFVDTKRLESLFDFMKTNREVQCLHLTDRGPHYISPSQYTDFGIVEKDQTYRISCQIAFWRKQEIMKLLRDYETAWEFEMVGSKRSSALNHLYLAVNDGKVKYNEYEIIPYVVTGIVKGKWKIDVVPVFQRNGINIDFEKRGFWDGTSSSLTLQQRVCRRIRYIRSEIDIFFIKIQERNKRIFC